MALGIIPRRIDSSNKILCGRRGCNGLFKTNLDYKSKTLTSHNQLKENERIKDRIVINKIKLEAFRTYEAQRSIMRKILISENVSDSFCYTKRHLTNKKTKYERIKI
jgi:hypothetical protein